MLTLLASPLLCVNDGNRYHTPPMSLASKTTVNSVCTALNGNVPYEIEKI